MAKTIAKIEFTLDRNRKNNLLERPAIADSILPKASSDNPTIYIYDEIGSSDWWPAISDKDVILALEAIGRVPAIDVRINSPGGDVFMGDAIYNALNRNPAKINVYIDGLAASAASYIAMAGDSIEIAENGFLMIHNAWSIAMGNAKEFTKTAELLSKIDGNIAAIYAARSGNEASKFTELMDAETWLTANEALEMKMVDRVGQNLKTPPDTAAKACAKFAKAPSALRALAKSHEEEESKKPTPKLDRLSAFIGAR
jgi:ATP-dependent Clp protease, protease subunit